MLRHVLLLKLKEGVRPEQIDAIDAGLRRLMAQIPAVAQGRFGRALGLPGSSGEAADYAIALDFESPADFQAYIQDPRHQAFVRETLAPVRLAAWSAQIAL